MSEWQWHVRNPGPCEACGKDCADRVTIQEANVDPGHYCDTCAQVEFLNRSAPQFRTVGCDSPGPAVFYSCAQCDAAMDADAARASLFCSGCKAKPPTLREWLGDRVSELGPWAEVLRDLPEPAGHIEELLLNSSTGWLDYIASGEHGDEHGSLTRDAAIAATNPDDPFYEALQMALFTRHPAVKPDPRPAAIVCEDQYEVIP